MSSTVNAVSAATITMYSLAGQWSTVGLFVVALLVVLLVQKELFRILGKHHSEWLQVLDFVIVPLLLAFGFHIAVSVLSLILSPQ